MRKIALVFICLLAVMAGCSQTANAPAPSGSTAAIATASAAFPATAEPSDTVAATDTPSPSPVSTPTAAPTPTPSFDPTISLTTGLKTGKPYKPVCVMIENTPEARPQSGIGQADIVYEMYVESNITRFMCVFNDTLPKTVGPVRSMRVYYADIADEYKGAVAFFGGNETGDTSIYARLAKSKYAAVMNGVTGPGGKYFWRSKARPVPHNAYTNVAVISDAMKTALAPEQHFVFDATAAYTGNDINTIKLAYNSNTISTYDYDPANKNYKRSISGKPMMDDLTKKQVTVTNVIVQHTNLKYTHDYKGHVFIYFIGSGKADIFVAGKWIKANWEKKAATSPTRYFGDNGNDIKLLPGNTWVQVVSSGVGISYK